MSPRSRDPGPFLSESPKPEAPPPKVTKYDRHSAAIVRALGAGEATEREIAERSGLGVEAVNMALFPMQIRGVVRKAGTRPRPDGHVSGRREEALYMLVPQ